MFNFMKKSTVLDTGGGEERDAEKERRKKEKKERKEREKRERIAAGLEEPLRLEEVRRSLKLRGRRKEKEKLPSGITADYTASLFAHLEQDSNYSNYPLIPTSGSNSNLSDENNHLSPGYPTQSWSKREGVLQSDSSETSLNSLNNPNNANTSPRQPPNLPPIPPRPPKRGILKGPRLSNTSNNSQHSDTVQTADTTDFVNGQDPNVLARNTQQNELISYGMASSKSTSSSDDMQQLQNFTKKVIHSPVENQYKNNTPSKNYVNVTITTQDVDEAPKTNGNSYQGVTSTSPSADSLTDTTTNSSFATPPFSTSPVGESQGFHRWSKSSNFEDVFLPLPPLTPLQLPKPRILTIQRQKAPRNDFGFSLRRAVIQERVFIGDLKTLNGHEENGLTNGDSKCNGNINMVTSKLTYKAVILAEPGSYPGSSETGLLPGDRLLEVNGVSVEGKSREEVIDLIKGSQDSVTVKVQPIAELCELSRRRAADGGSDVELTDSNVRGGTLSRSGSRRFHSTQGSFVQSLRGGDEISPSGNKTLAALAKIHRHCTGKAHANGCIDTKHNPLAKSDSNASIQSKKSFRSECFIEIKEADKNNQNFLKNGDGFTKSFSNSTSSYEGHSDTDSENTFKSRPEQKVNDPCERLFTQNTKASLMKTARMRYADDSIISSLRDEIDGEKKAFNRTSLRASYREPRKSAVVTIEEVKSDGSNNDEELANALLFDEKRKPITPTKTGLQKKMNGSAAVNGKSPVNGTKPPWRGTGKKVITNEISFVRQPSLRGSVRKKKADGIPWQRLYELSLWRKVGVSFAAVGADNERALLRPWSELSSQPLPPYPEAKSEEQLACEKEWLKAGHMWLAHRGGFTAVVREGDADAGRARVRVLHSGETLTVDEDDLEKANPPQLERCEDIASLRCLNECGALHVLRSRYAAGLPHARAGHALLVMGPPRRTTPAYTDKVAAMFRGCRADDMPPHIFAAAQSAHRCMLASRRDRAIVFLGRSGSGKTSAMRHCVWYLASAYPAQGSKLTPERLDAAFDALYAFGTSRTGTNHHASRFVSLASLDFDGGGALVSASVQTLLPDLRPYHTHIRAIHTLFHGCDGRLRRDLLLDQAPVNSPNPFISSSEKADAPTHFSALKEALKLLNVTEQEQMAIWRIVAAICHLGWAGVAKTNTAGSGLKYQFASGGCATRAAKLLGVGAEELARAIFSSVPTSPQGNNNLRTPSPSNEKEVTGSEALDAFVSGLYNETFNIIAALVNRSLSTSARTSASILLLDTPGADNPMCAGQQSGAPLSKLLSNYLQERLQAVFHDAMLVAPRERYAQEGITLDDGAEEDWLSETVNPGPMVELLDKSPQNTIVRSSQADLRDADRRGLLWLLDEESMYPGSSDDTFLERVLQHYAAPNHTQYLIKKAPHARQFVLQHLQGTNPVLYDVTGWVKASRENPVIKKALTLLQESQFEDISRLCAWSRGACGVGAWSAAAGDASTLRRASSIRRTLTTGTAGMKRRSTALQAKFVADGIVDTLRRCGSGGVQFVCCLLTNHPSEGADDVNVPLLRSQFRGFQLLDASRLYKQGFPEHMPLSEFARRYRLLATSESESEEKPPSTQLSDRQIVDDMLSALDLDVTSYRLGLSQIMFRGGVVGGLDARRDAALARVLVRLQARARGLLTRRRAQRLRTQHTAARCIQRNVRAFLAVRDWPWWRLLVRVTPLLAVHRTEHRLKQAQEELESLKSKLEKVEGERTHYKNETEKLENKLSEVGGELTEERAACALATERADAEAAERLRVERDNRDLLANNQRLQQASERLELELLHWRSAESGGAEPSDSEGSEADATGSADKYKRRYEQAHRELQLLRAQLRRQHEDDLEQLVMVKKQLEKKVQDAYEEVEEQRAVAAQWKRKLQKLTNDMADLRSLLDEQTCRNNLLEKRQRKFDSELHGAQEELKRERSAKERLSRERDQAIADKFALEQSMSELRLELELKEERLAAATRELEERGGGGDEVTALRRAKTELERRVRDQEEELDDLAGQIQLLESSKLRLEMLLEQQRKEARLEAAARDDEMEETRANAAKKLKMLESQLESEHSERSLLLRERHELERRLASLEETARAETHEQAQLVQRLKRDLKRYRALLRDAQTMLEQKEKEGGGKAQIRQLKNQVEDLELSLRGATKARQAAEAEAAEAAAALDEAARARNDAAERALAATRDAAHARAMLDDAEEEAAELLKKYRASTSALCAAQAEAREAGARADQAAEDARQARDKLAELSARLASAEAGHSHGHAEAERRLELRNKELESSLELEATARARVEGQLSRLRDAHDQLAAELASARLRDQHAADELRKLQRQLREVKEENNNLNGKLSEALRAKCASEAAVAAAAAEAASAREEARLAARRAAALQEAIAGDLSSPNDSRDTDSDNDSYSSDESIGTFLANHKLSPHSPHSPPSRASAQQDSQKSQTPEGRASRLSAGSGKQLSPTKESFA